jgi:hypothetical protein
MSRRTKLCLTALFLVLLAIPVGYVGLTWHVGEPLHFRYTGMRHVPVTVKGGPLGERHEQMLVIDFEADNANSIDIYLWEAHLLPKAPSTSDPVDATLLIGRSSSLGQLHPEASGPALSHRLGFTVPEPSPVPAHGIRRFSVLTSKETAAKFHPAKAHVLYTWRTATQHRVDKVLWWCRSLLPEKYRDNLRGPGYTMDITPIVIPPPDPFDTDSP